MNIVMNKKNVVYFKFDFWFSYTKSYIYLCLKIQHIGFSPQLIRQYTLLEEKPNSLMYGLWSSIELEKLL